MQTFRATIFEEKNKLYTKIQRYLLLLFFNSPQSGLRYINKNFPSVTLNRILTKQIVSFTDCHPITKNCVS